MRKLSYRLSDDLIQEARRRARWPKVLFVSLLVLSLAPLALDGVAICLGHWKEALGSSSDVRTPTLDRVADNLHELSDELWMQMRPITRSLPWDPKMVIPATVIVMGMSMMLLRR